MPGIEFDQTDERHELNRYPLWPWIELVPGTSFNQTAPTTSTLTMLEDHTANIVRGCAIRFTLSGAPYYAMCEAIAAGLLTIAGAPFTLGAGDVDGLWYSPDPGMVTMMSLFVQGNFADAADNALLRNDMEQGLRWAGQRAYLVRIAHIVDVDDTGPAQPRVNARIAGVNVCTANAAAGRDVSDAAWVETDIDISTAAYDIDPKDAIELTSDANGALNDASDVSVQLTFVAEA